MRYLVCGLLLLNLLMKKSIYKVELHRAICSWGFSAALLIGCGLALGHAYRTWSILQSTLSNELSRYRFESTYYTGSGFLYSLSYDLYYWECQLFFYILPLLAALPHATSYTQDRKSGFQRILVLRCGRMGYVKAKLLSVFVSGGLVAAIPQLFSLALVSLLIPLRNVDLMGLYRTPGVTFYKLLVSHTGLYFLFFILIDFIIFGIFSMISLLISLVTDIRFTAWASPFLVYLFLHHISGSISESSTSSPIVFAVAVQMSHFDVFWVITEMGVLLLAVLVVFPVVESKRDLI